MRPLSARNPRVRALAKLVRRREERAEQRAFVVEGPVLIDCALAAGAVLVDLFVDEAELDRPAVASTLEGAAPQVDPWVLPPGTLDRIGDAVTSQGLVAVVEHRDAAWPSPDGTDFVLVLDAVSDPGNAGTLLRAAVAAGAGAVVVAGGVDLTGPKVVRSSAGAIFSTDVVVAASAGQACDRLRAAGYRLFGSVVAGGEAYDSVDLTGSVALVVGNEAHGISFEVADHVDSLITIPMAGPTESLNVAMAGTVIAFEVLRQRRSI